MEWHPKSEAPYPLFKIGSPVIKSSEIEHGGSTHLMAAPTKVTALDTPLTPQEQEYVRLRGLGMAQVQAAKGAGYARADKNAHLLEKRPRVQAALAKIHEETRQRMRIEREDVVAGLQEAIEYAKRMDDPGNIIAGWREIAKILGLYEPETKRIEVTATQKRLMTRLENISDAELFDLMQKEQDSALIEAIEGEFEEVMDDETDG